MSRIKPIQIISIAFLFGVSVARAQEPTLLDYVKDHVSVVSGVAAANGARSEYVSLSLDDDFELAPKLHGMGSLSLFGRQRVAGESIIDPEVPTSLDALALYSAGQVEGGLYYTFTDKIALECRGGMTFAMIGITGKMGDPVDPTKFLFGCGVRLTGGPGRLSVLPGHYGPVDAGAKWYGFIPTTTFDGEFRLPNGMSFLARVAAGRDLSTNKAVTSSWFAIRKHF